MHWDAESVPFLKTKKYITLTATWWRFVITPLRTSLVSSPYSVSINSSSSYWLDSITSFSVPDMSCEQNSSDTYNQTKTQINCNQCTIHNCIILPCSNEEFYSITHDANQECYQNNSNMTSGPSHYTSDVYLSITVSVYHVTHICFLPVRSIWHCNTAFSVHPRSRSYRRQWSVIVSTCQPYHQRVLQLSASATTCSTISDHRRCSRSSSSNDSQPSRLLQQSACWSTYWPNVASTVSFMCGRSTCARPAWSCSSVSNQLVEFPAACHVQVMSADIQVSARSGTRLPVALLHVTDLRSWPASVNVHLTQTNCWYHGHARPALDRIPSVLLVRLPGMTCRHTCVAVT